MAGAKGHPLYDAIWKGIVQEAQQIQRLIAPAIEAMGFRVVRIGFAAGNNPTLQIMAEPSDGRPMNVEDCALISRQVSALLDVDDPIPSAYTLEVSSPGIDRLLLDHDDYLRFAGFEARIELGQGVTGRKRFRGLIEGVEGRDHVILNDTSLGRVKLLLADIVKAKLVLTDALIAATQDNRIPPPAGQDAGQEAVEAGPAEAGPAEADPAP